MKRSEEDVTNTVQCTEKRSFEIMKWKNGSICLQTEISITRVEEEYKDTSTFVSGWRGTAVNTVTYYES